MFGVFFFYHAEAVTDALLFYFIFFLNNHLYTVELS